MTKDNDGNEPEMEVQTPAAQYVEALIQRLSAMLPVMLDRMAFNIFARLVDDDELGEIAEGVDISEAVDLLFEDENLPDILYDPVVKICANYLDQEFFEEAMNDALDPDGGSGDDGPPDGTLLN